MKLLFIAIAIVSLSGCLTTRDQLRETANARESQAQQQQAMQQARYTDLEQDLREMKGKVAALENQLNMSQSEKNQIEARGASERTQFESRLKMYEEALNKMEAQYLALSQKVEAMHTEPAPEKAETKSGAAGKSKLGSFEQGEEDLKNKNFRQAIVNYQKYREANPKGKNYPEATYKMGVCFQELKMKDEASPFFNEVIEKFPKSKSADKAKIRLRQLK